MNNNNNNKTYRNCFKSESVGNAPKRFTTAANNINIKFIILPRVIFVRLSFSFNLFFSVPFCVNVLNSISNCLNGNWTHFICVLFVAWLRACCVAIGHTNRNCIDTNTNIIARISTTYFDGLQTKMFSNNLKTIRSKCTARCDAMRCNSFSRNHLRDYFIERLPSTTTKIVEWKNMLRKSKQ